MATTDDVLFLDYTLNTQPGRIPPTIKIKEGTNGALLNFYIKINNPEYPDDQIQMETNGCGIIKATREDGSDFFFAVPMVIEEDYFIVSTTNEIVTEFSKIPGLFKATISIIDVDYSTNITQENYEEYDLITVQPCFIKCAETAYGHDNSDGSFLNNLQNFLGE